MSTDTPGLLAQILSYMSGSKTAKVNATDTGAGCFELSSGGVEPPRHGTSNTPIEIIVTSTNVVWHDGPFIPNHFQLPARLTSVAILNGRATATAKRRISHRRANARLLQKHTIGNTKRDHRRIRACVSMASNHDGHIENARSENQTATIVRLPQERSPACRHQQYAA